MPSVAPTIWLLTTIKSTYKSWFRWGLLIMHRFRFAALAAVAVFGFASVASAADPSVKAQPPLSSPSVYSWSGFYAGLNAGGGWGNTTIDNSMTPGTCSQGPQACPSFFGALNTYVPAQFDTHPSGFIGGGQIGYNYQIMPNWVAGLEADFQGADIKGAANASNSAPIVLVAVPETPIFTLTAAGRQKIDWFGTVRGRLGWLPINSLLVYATGGLAYGHVQTGVSFSGNIPTTSIIPLNGSSAVSQSKTLAGWTVGGGLEWMFAPRWSVKGEYLYYDLGTVILNQTTNYVLTLIGPAFFYNANMQSAAHYRGNIARIGLNYKF